MNVGRVVRVVGEVVVMCVECVQGCVWMFV